MSGICLYHVISVVIMLFAVALILAKKEARKQYIFSILLVDILAATTLAILGSCSADWWVFAFHICVTAEISWGKLYFQRENKEF